MKDPLLVIDRLEVGPPQLDPDRVRCPYVVVQGKQRTVLELSYRFDEPVFTPGSADSMNLASMMTAQVALNYGLFCRTLVFKGDFDRPDRRFLADMAENTAREILVKKFLEPNPFLLGEAAQVQAAKQDTYLRATLEFSDEPGPDRGPVEAFPWNSRPQGHAVLSSGGKDSLLTYGLLRDIGVETHSIFVNESGKHWFTALNAHRGLKDRDPRTARVWTNSDRVFNAMLRLLPFIRPDFQRLRSDEYPIRLWTVAVFLFGALPLLRKRGLGRLLIGDEFDTSVRATHQGISHYDGLYDQSIYFDQALTRYFQRKAWNVTQFSLLRPLSEMLIEKCLAEGYPDLLPLQVSCHAAHVDDGRVRPCGECEKCRRIVGMLIALGQDPTIPGYTEGQIQRCLEALGRHGVHQEQVGSEHLMHLLVQAGRVHLDREPHPHPEILKLRFHPDRSPMNAIPEDLRTPLYTRLQRHTLGALRRKGREWVDFDPLDPGEHTHPKRGGGVILGELTWPQAEKRMKEVDVVLLPVGSIEQHGPHLSLDTDAYDAEYLSIRVAEACSDPKPIVLPLISYGVSYHHEDFPGTVSVSPDTLSKMVYEIGMDLARQGVNKIVMINGHGGNSPALHFAAQLINRDARIFTCVDTGETSDSDLEKLSDTPNDVHAGEIETSTSLATRPKLVKMAKAKRMVPQFSNRYLDFTSRHSVGWYVRTERISKTGVMGDPTKASAEKGRQMWDIMVKNLVELVESIKGLSLEEIYQRRY